MRQLRPKVSKDPKVSEDLKVSKVSGEWFQNEKPCKRNQTAAVAAAGIRLQAKRSKRSWCRENGVSYSSYMRWQKVIREQAADAVLAPEEHAIVPIRPAGGKTPSLEDSSQQIQIRKEDLVMTLPATVEPEYLAAVVQSLV